MVLSKDDLRGIIAVKALLRETYMDLSHAVADLGLQDSYDEGKGAEYPQKQLVRRVWFYGQPGTEGVPEPGHIDPNGLSALVALLRKRRGNMEKGFWSVLGECVGQKVEGHPIVVRIRPDTVEFYFKSYPGWESKVLPTSWPDFVVDRAFRPATFPWNVERDGDSLRFTPTDT
ncbi:MAG: hypothetical protein HYZ29_07900 [Myxococcales bacterium]|nr:hypothetical protein [Myxococcales bacterium]